MNNVGNNKQKAGFTLIEVLLTIVIIAIGLLGLAGLQVATVNNQFEAYQRAQALMLLEDMSNRVRANAAAARNDEYFVVVANDYGLQPVEDCTDDEATTAERDLCEWNTALSGAGTVLEVEGVDSNVGSIQGARGCIEDVVGTADGETIVRLTIAWQGRTPTQAPVSACGQNAYGDDEYRRTVSLDTVLANL